MILYNWFHSFVYIHSSMMLSTFTLSLNGNESALNVDFMPALELDADDVYECALVYFKTFNSIPNVDKSNNLFEYGDKKIIIPEGSYELNDIIKYLNNEMIKQTHVDGNGSGLIEINLNTNTSKCMIFSPKHDIHFDRKNSIGSLFGYSPKTLKATNDIYWSDQSINILITNTIRIECNIVEGSFINNKPSHVIHEFSPDVPPGYQIIEQPSHIIYLPVKKCSNIQRVEVRIINEHGNLVNFRGENISLRLHVKKIK